MSWAEVYVRETVEQASAASALQYRVRFEVRQAFGIEPELFVYAVHDDSYSHVATVYDLNTFPTHPGVARSEDKDFYRRRVLELTYPTKPQAAEAAAHIKGRLARVNREWQAFDAQKFGGDEVLILDSGEQ